MLTQLFKGKYERSFVHCQITIEDLACSWIGLVWEILGNTIATLKFSKGWEGVEVRHNGGHSRRQSCAFGEDYEAVYRD